MRSLKKSCSHGQWAKALLDSLSVLLTFLFKSTLETKQLGLGEVQTGIPPKLCEGIYNLGGYVLLKCVKSSVAYRFVNVSNM